MPTPPTLAPRPVAAHGPLDERELGTWRSFFRMTELLRGRLEQRLVAHSGLSNADYSVLVALSEVPEGQMRACTLGEELAWEKSRLHHQLTRMAARGLVARETGPARSAYARITDGGFAALRAAVPLHTADVRELFLDRLDAEQAGRLEEISRVLLRGLTSGAGTGDHES